MRLTAVVSLLSLLAVSCGGSEPDPNDPSQMQGQYGGQYPPGQYPPGQYQPGGYQQPGPYGQPQPGQPQPGQPQPGQPQPQPGQPQPGQPAAAGGQAQPIAAGALATPLLMPLQQQNAPGMQPEGQAFAGQFQEGQTMEQPLTLNPGKCYTVIAVSMGIQELDAMIAAQPLPQVPPAPLAQDAESGPQAIVAGKGNCYKNMLPAPVPAKVIVKATRGGGQAVAQIYVK